MMPNVLMQADTTCFEIDFLAVGDGERSGDAIALRYGSPWTGYTVIVVDSGTKETGEQLVELIRTHYNTDVVHHAVNTHPDGDHASGLTVVLEKLRVGALWMHRPWNHAAAMMNLFKSGRITTAGLKRRTREALSAAWDLEQVARRRGVPIYEPFQGMQIGAFLVLSPTRNWYRTLVANFDGTPAPHPAVAGLGLRTEPSLGTILGGLGLGRPPEPRLATILSGQTRGLGLRSGLLDTMLATDLSVQTRRAKDPFPIWEIHERETLGEDGKTSPENESSTVLYTNLGGGVLLTGDAGRQALTAAANFANTLGIDLRRLEFMQIPHHGSRRNVSPSILNRVVARIAYVSAAAESPTHPRRVVTNAFTRRGTQVFATKGVSLRYSRGMGLRAGYGAAQPLPFYYKVEGSS